MKVNTKRLLASTFLHPNWARAPSPCLPLPSGKVHFSGRSAALTTHGSASGRGPAPSSRRQCAPARPGRVPPPLPGPPRPAPPRPAPQVRPSSLFPGPAGSAGPQVPARPCPPLQPSSCGDSSPRELSSSHGSAPLLGQPVVAVPGAVGLSRAAPGRGQFGLRSSRDRLAVCGAAGGAGARSAGSRATSGANQHAPRCAGRAQAGTGWGSGEGAGS